MKTRVKLLLIMLLVVCLSPLFAANFTANATERNSLTVLFNGNSVFYYDEIITPTDHTVSEEIFEFKINSSPEQKISKVEELINKGYSVKKAMLAVYPRLKFFVMDIARKVYRSAENASMHLNESGKPDFIIHREKKGAALDEKTFFRDLFEGWKRGNRAVIRVKTSVIQPEITAMSLTEFTYKRGRFSTRFNAENEPRRHNIELATSKINGIKIGKGEQFSFNKTVGIRSEKNGFTTAKIIVGGEYVDGVGGGVCQVSTTLYNACLLSDLSVDEAGSHSLVPSYVEPSFDAMVNSGSADLKFTNNTSGDVFIRAECEAGVITVTFYGEQNPYFIERKSVIEKTLPVPDDKIIDDTTGKYFSPDAESGELMRIRSAKSGLTSSGYLIYKKEGKIVKTRKIREDRYLSVCGILVKKP